MRCSTFWNGGPCDAATLKRWCRGIFAGGALLALLTIAASIAASERRHAEDAVITSGIGHEYSGGGNLVPIF